MNNINIFGFPKSMKKTRIYHIIKSVVFGRRLRSKFWIQDIQPDSDPNFVVVSINIVKNSDVGKALDLINDFIYYDIQNDLHLSAVNVTNPLTSKEYNECIPKETDQAKRDREVRMTRQSKLPPEPHYGRSRSPHLTTDVAKLDLEIQLVRKERLLVVEQRKLLLEKKRLELLQEFVPGSINDLESYAATIEKYTLDNDRPQIPQKVVPINKRVAPVPVLASRAIVRQMKDTLSKRHKIRGIVAMPLFFALRKRINELAQSKSQLQPDDIVRLYREAYPVDTDEVLLDQIEAQIQKNTQAVKNKTASDVIDEVEAEAKLSGQSDSGSVEGELKNEREDEKSKKEQLIRNTDVVNLVDAELDDWLEDDSDSLGAIQIDAQAGNGVKEKENNMPILGQDDNEGEKGADIDDLEKEKASSV